MSDCVAESEFLTEDKGLRLAQGALSYKLGTGLDANQQVSGTL